MILDCLPWSYPGWIRGRFSQDATDWFVAFLEVARKQYGMEMNWVSAAQNENGTDRNWIVGSVRPTLDERGFRAVKLQTPDCDKDYWKVFDEFATDRAYRDAVEAVGYHYLNGREPWQIDQASGRDTTPARRGVRQATLGQRGMEHERRHVGRHRGDVPGPLAQQALHPRPRVQDGDLVPDRLDLRRSALVRYGGDAGRGALVRALRGVAGRVGRRRTPPSSPGPAGSTWTAPAAGSTRRPGKAPASP